MDDVLRLVIPGRPVPKKNSAQIVYGKSKSKSGNPRAIILPSKAFREYEEVALKYIRTAMPGQFCEPVTVRCQYWPPTKQWWPDLVGLLQGTSDILQAAGVLEDDRLIVDYNGSRIMGLDKYNPRAEIYIQAMGKAYISPDPYVEKKRAQSLF